MKEIDQVDYVAQALPSLGRDTPLWLFRSDEPWVIASLTKTAKGRRRWEVVLYDDPEMRQAKSWKRFTESGALSKVAFEFAARGVSVAEKLMEVAREFR